MPTKERPQPSNVEKVLREVFEPSLVRAEKDFYEIALQLLHLDPHNLPPYLDLFINNQLTSSVQTIFGENITMAIMDDNHGDPPWIGHHFKYEDLPEHCYWILVFPELFPDGSSKLSLGMLKRDGRRLYTTWADSHYPLSAQPRHRERNLSDIWLVQRIHPGINATRNDMEVLVWNQLRDNKQYGAMYLFTPGVPLEERHQLPPLKESLEKLRALSGRRRLFSPSFLSK